MDAASTAQCIRIAMARADLTALELADKMNVPLSNVYRWKSRGCTSVDVLGRIAKACDMSLCDLLEGVQKA